MTDVSRNLQVGRGSFPNRVVRGRHLTHAQHRSTLRDRRPDVAAVKIPGGLLFG